MTNREIEQTVSAVYEKYVRSGNSYKQFINIMQSEGIKYKKVPFKNAGFVGALTRGNNGQCYIMVNDVIDNIGRENFTIAHELGHYFLQHQLQASFIYCSDNDISEAMETGTTIEREANHFASSLLMPEHKIKSAFLAMLQNSKRIKSNGFLQIKNDFTFGVWCGIRDNLVKRYGVSETALRYRLRYLNLVEFEFQEGEQS